MKRLCFKKKYIASLFVHCITCIYYNVFAVISVLCTVIQCIYENVPNFTWKPCLFVRVNSFVVAPSAIPRLSGKIPTVLVYSSSHSAVVFVSVSDIFDVLKNNFTNLEQCVKMAGRKLSRGTVHPLASITVQHQVQTVHGTGLITKFLLQFPGIR